MLDNSRPLTIRKASLTPAGARDLVVDRWGARFQGQRFPCAVGRGGIGAKARDGDGITPTGTHRIEAVLVRADRITAACLGVTAVIGPRDGWSDDPADPDYNGWVERPHGFSHEAMFRADPQYDLVAVLDWNRHPAAPGRGSAIFLHVWRRPRWPTAGCIAFARDDLAFILSRWTARSRVIVRE